MRAEISLKNETGNRTPEKISQAQGGGSRNWKGDKQIVGGKITWQEIAGRIAIGRETFRAGRYNRTERSSVRNPPLSR
jgi:hypothetical protein